MSENIGRTATHTHIDMAPKTRKAMPTPSQRAAEHAQKIKAEKERREANISPGPGAYDPQKSKGTSQSSPSSAFNSHTDRTKAVPSSASPNAMGDPGSYEVMGYNSVKAQASSTFNTSAKKGARGFGGTSKRELRPQNRNPTSPGADDETTPAPTSYTPTTTETGREADMHVMTGAEAMKSSSFASNSAQRGKCALPQEANPGAGAYSPTYKAQLPHVGNLVSKTGRDHKFVSDNLDGVGNDSSTLPHVGPGSYSPLRTASGESDGVGLNVERMGYSLSASVASEVIRPKLDDLW